MTKKSHTPSRFLRAALVPAALLLAVPAVPRAQTAAPAEEEVDVELLQKRLSIAEREAALARQRLRELRAELEELGPYLEEARYRKLVAEISEEVAQLRGLELKQAVNPVILDRTALKALLDELLATELTEDIVRGETLTWTTFELLPEDADLRLLYGNLLEEQVGGLYDDRRKSLYVVDTFDPTSFFGKVILAHEICHALQDQHYPIEDLPFRTENNDQNLAMAAVLEGDATLLMVEWGAEDFSPAVLLGMNEVFSQQTETLNTVPPALVQSMLFPYIAGLEFITAGVMMEGDSVRDRAFREPPQSTEQILHPEKWLQQNDPPVEVALPEWEEGDGLQEVNRGPVGEWITRLILAQPEDFPQLTFLSTDVLVSEPTAVEGAAGWGGDLLVSVASADDARRFIVWKSVWDTQTDAEEFDEALTGRVATYDRFTDGRQTQTHDGATVFLGEDGDHGLIERDGSEVLVIMASSGAELETAREWLARNREGG